MRQKILAAGTTYLDMSDELPIPIKITVADIRDVDKKKGAPHSRETILPSTPVNDAFFGGLYDINSDNTIFNPNVKTDCLFTHDDEEIINGYLQLKSVLVDDRGDINYQIVMYDEAANFWNDIEKLLLKDLTGLSDLDHTLNRDNVVDSWDMTWDTDGGTGNSDLTTGGVYYGLTYNAKPIQEINTDFKPALFYKRLLDMIVTETGRTWSGDLKDSARFAREVIPYNGDVLQISLAEAQAKTCLVDRGSNVLVLTDGDTFGTIAQTDVQIELDNEPSDPNNLWILDTFTAPTGGQYRFRYDVDVAMAIEYIDQKTFLGGIIDQTKVKLVAKFFNASATLVDEQVVSLVSAPIVYTTLNNGAPQTKTAGGTFSGSGIFLGDVTSMNRYMGAGWTLELHLRIESGPQEHYWGAVAPDTAAEVQFKTFTLAQGSLLESMLIQYSLGEGDTITMSEIIDQKAKQKDLLKDLKARYNLYIYQNPDDDNDIVFDFRDEFYQSGPILDLTGFRDESTRTEIRMIGELQSESILLTYKEAKDIYNKTYSEASDSDVYGEYEYLFGNEFVKGEQKIQTPFEPTPMIAHGAMAHAFTPWAMIVPSIDSEAPKTGMRVLYASEGKIDHPDSSISIGWAFKYRDGTGTLQQEGVVGYPYMGHYDNPWQPTFSINFGQINPAMYDGLQQLPNDNLYERYWKNTITQIANGKMDVCLWNLRPDQVAFIKRNPNTRIFEKNKYYYINVIDYEGNLNLGKKTRMELISIEDELTVDVDTPARPNIGDTTEITGVIIKQPPGGGKPYGGTGTTIADDATNIRHNGSRNKIGSGASNVDILGNDNEVGPGVRNAVIQGDNVKIFADNVTVRNRDDVIVNIPNVTIDGDMITYNGQTTRLFNVVNGGQDETRNTFATSNIGIVDGGKDEIRTKFADNYVIGIIDGNRETETNIR